MTCMDDIFNYFYKKARDLWKIEHTARFVYFVNLCFKRTIWTEETYKSQQELAPEGFWSGEFHHLISQLPLTVLNTDVNEEAKRKLLSLLPHLKYTVTDLEYFNLYKKIEAIPCVSFVESLRISIPPIKLFACAHLLSIDGTELRVGWFFVNPR